MIEQFSVTYQCNFTESGTLHVGNLEWRVDSQQWQNNSCVTVHHIRLLGTLLQLMTLYLLVSGSFQLASFVFDQDSQSYENNTAWQHKLAVKLSTKDQNSGYRVTAVKLVNFTGEKCPVKISHGHCHTVNCDTDVTSDYTGYRRIFRAVVKSRVVEEQGNKLRGETINHSLS